MNYFGGQLTVFRCILPEWAAQEDSTKPRVIEGQFNDSELYSLNSAGYNIYYLPNYPQIYTPEKKVDGAQIDTFEWVFIDMDLKDKKYATKEDFVDYLLTFKLKPSKIIDSGNGVHAYWRVTDLDAKSYLRLQRRLVREFDTDEAVGQIFQLMRYPGYINTKYKEALGVCQELHTSTQIYTCEDLDKVLPIITNHDEEHCKRHYEKTYAKETTDDQIEDKIPLKFAHLLKDNSEVKDIWSGGLDDRSKGDYRLGHIMFASSFTRREAISVLVNSAKALQRAPVHRLSYAINIVDKIWEFEESDNKSQLTLSSTVKDILSKQDNGPRGKRLPCHRYIDATDHGFRLGQVLGLVAGSGVGKTSIALNMFFGFVKNNPDYEHFFITLEQPADEIAERWKILCEKNEKLYEKVHIISNYAEEGQFRHLSLAAIQDYIVEFQKQTEKKVGCVVIDHIGALKKKGKTGENQDLMDICHSMKAFAIQTNTLLIMQSQAPREKAGIGDLELNKDAAYGTVYFESYCDYLITVWQPLKRCYKEGAPTTTAFKFCKIRHKKQGVDEIQEDTRYILYFDPLTQQLRELTQDEEKSFIFWNNRATNLRKQDRKTDVLEYNSRAIK